MERRRVNYFLFYVLEKKIFFFDIQFSFSFALALSVAAFFVVRCCE